MYSFRHSIMKKPRYILTVSVATLAIVACNDIKDEVVMGPEIQFSASLTGETKASGILNSIPATAEFMVYGINPESLRGGDVLRKESTVWTSANTHHWDSGEDHAFYGWTKNDGSSEASSFFKSFSRVDNTLTVDRTFSDLSDSDFDFCYSDAVVRTAANPDYSTVDLAFRHLFAAVGFSAHNYTQTTIVIQHVKLYGLKNRKTASLSFNTSTGGPASVSFSNEECTWATGKELVSGTVTLVADAEKANVVNGASDESRFFLFWPQSVDELTATETIDPGTGNVTYVPNGTENPVIEITYTQDGGDPMIVAFPLPHDSEGWAAGTRRQIELAFTKKYLKLNVSAMDWNDHPASIDYNGVATVTGPLTFDPSSCNIVGHNVYFKSGMPIRASFTVDQPSHSTWLVAKLEDFDAFEVDNVTPGSNDAGTIGDGEDTAFGVVDAQSATIAIYPKIADPKRDYKLQLRFSVRTSSEQILDINDAVQPTVYTIILQKD